MEEAAARFRMTRQRRIMLEELAKMRSHPTADEVHRAVRRSLPRVSLGTVYRNLEMLSSQGRIRKLDAAGSRARFDGKTTDHYHVVCTRCGVVSDLPMAPKEEMNRAAQAESDFRITGHSLTFKGLCPECWRKEQADLRRQSSRH